MANEIGAGSPQTDPVGSLAPRCKSHLPGLAARVDLPLDKVFPATERLQLLLPGERGRIAFQLDEARVLRAEEIRVPRKPA